MSHMTIADLIQLLERQADLLENPDVEYIIVTKYKRKLVGFQIEDNATNVEAIKLFKVQL